METEIKATMFEKGKNYTCIRTINLNGEPHFTENKEYLCPSNNCLVDNSGKELFITTNFLPYFFK